MGMIITLVVYAERERGKPDWDFKWEMVKELAAHWLVRKLEGFPKESREFVMLNEVQVEME
jgi:hypothetical protein